MSNETNLNEEPSGGNLPDQELPGVGQTSASEILDPEPATDESPHTAGSPHAADLISLLQENFELTKKLEEAVKKAEDAQRSELLAQADYQNFRKRSDERAIEMQKYNTAEFIKALIPAVDNFERAIMVAEQNQSFDALIGGVKGTLKQLQTALQKAGVTPIEALGKEFDPKFHEAIGHAESDEYPSNTVAEEVQRGYILHDRVLRPTLVRVTD